MVFLGLRKRRKEEERDDGNGDDDDDVTCNGDSCHGVDGSVHCGSS